MSSFILSGFIVFAFVVVGAVVGVLVIEGIIHGNFYLLSFGLPWVWDLARAEGEPFPDVLFPVALLQFLIYGLISVASYHLFRVSRLRSILFVVVLHIVVFAMYVMIHNIRG